MAGIVISAIGLAIILLYTLQMLRYGIALAGFKMAREDITEQGALYVSLIVPVRNEMGSLENLLSDIAKQDYPEKLFEVIFIDDHSDDGSDIYLSERCNSHKNFSLIRLDSKLQGKKTAITKGCENARGEWIIQTDADCSLPACFVSGHAKKAASGDFSLISGPVLTKNVKGLWNMMESLEFMALTGTGMASFLTGRPVLCSGANLSFSKKFYLEVAEDMNSVNSPSGDDIFLLIKAKQCKREITFLYAEEALVTTGLSGKPAAFFNQRVRWGSKSKYYKDSSILVLAALVWMSCASLTGILISSIFIKDLIWIFLLLLAVKSIADLLVLYNTSRLFKREYLLKVFPLAAIFYYFYITFAGAFAIAGLYSWKGRQHKK